MTTTDLSELGFYLWLQHNYGGMVRASYRTIAKQIGDISHNTSRLYLLSLEAKGLLTIENRGKRNQAYHLNRNEFERFMNE